MIKLDDDAIYESKEVVKLTGKCLRTIQIYARRFNKANAQWWTGREVRAVLLGAK